MPNGFDWESELTEQCLPLYWFVQREHLIPSITPFKYILSQGGLNITPQEGRVLKVEGSDYTRV